jgi:hypothetical protein
MHLRVHTQVNLEIAGGEIQEAWFVRRCNMQYLPHRSILTSPTGITLGISGDELSMARSSTNFPPKINLLIPPKSPGGLSARALTHFSGTLILNRHTSRHSLVTGQARLGYYIYGHWSQNISPIFTCHH